MISRRTILLSLCGMTVVFCLIGFHLLARYHLNRGHPSHLVTFYLQDVPLREALRNTFPGIEIHFECQESDKPPISMRVDGMSSVHVTKLLELLSDTLIYRRGERIVVTDRTGWYPFFYRIDAFVFNQSGVWLWNADGYL